MKKLSDKTTIGEARKAGRLGDEELVHLNRAEVEMLEGMTYGHGLTINPRTGEKEAFLPFLLSALPALFPGIGAALGGATGLSFLANPMVLGAIGSGLGTAIETGDVGKGVMAGLGGAALGHFGGKLLGGAAGSAAADAAKNPMAMAMEGGGGVADLARFGAGFAPQAVAPMAPYGLMQAGMVGMPGGMLASQEAMKYRETDDDKRRKDSIERAQHENFLAPRQVMTAPDGYRHGFDPEFSFFNPPGALTRVTTDRQYAGGGVVQPPRNMMPVPQLLGNRPAPQPAINPSVGIWNGLAPRPVRVPETAAPSPQAPGMSPVRGGLRPGIGGGGRGDAFGGVSKSPFDDMYMRMQTMENRNLMRYADGGLVQGPGDGTSDSIPALINGQEPAAISDGEFIVSADVVAALGNGSSKAGAQKLQAMMDAVRAGAAA